MLNRPIRFPLPVLLLVCLALTGTAWADEPADLGTGRLVLVPINMGVRPSPEVEAGIEPVWQEMLQHFGTGERVVTALEKRSATRLWKQIVSRLKRRGKRDVYAAYAEFAREIAGQVEYETMVFPSLVLRAARVQGTKAAWDGVRRRVDGPIGDDTVYRMAGADMIASSVGVSGEIAAASLHVAVLGPDGELRFEGAGGVALLQEVVKGMARSGGKLELALRDDPFADGATLREGVVAAFRQPLPASRAH